MVAMNWLQKISGFYGGDGYYGYWVDPMDNTYSMNDTHHSWIYHNQDLLRDEYGIDMEEWEAEYRLESEREIHEQLILERIRDIAFEQEIDESQVQLDEAAIEQLLTSAGESAEIPNGVELVDYLIKQGWVRVSKKSGEIQIEAVDDGRLIGKATDILDRLFPQIWENPRFRISINEQMVYSSDIQQSGSLEEALQQAARYRGLRR